MSEWKAKRFWTDADVEPSEDGFAVLLDGRSVRTPAKATLMVPTAALAEAIASEWREQGDYVDPTTMPVTRAANAAIDKVGPQRDEVVELLWAYADSDLLCYRADAPEALATRQAEAWDPLLDWADAQYSARLVPAVGVVHQPQARDALERLKSPLAGMNDFQLTAFHDLVGIPGSIVIGLAATQNLMTIEELWRRSRIDEDWQESQWGRDDEAHEVAKLKFDAFSEASRIFDLSTETD